MGNKGSSASGLDTVLQNEILGRNVMTPYGLCRAIAWEAPCIFRDIKIVVLTKDGIERKVNIDQVRLVK